MGNLQSAACCSSGDDDVREVLKKFAVKDIHKVRSGPLPQLVTGRVCPASNNMLSPVKGISCVYYYVDARRQDTSEKTGWAPAFSETKCVDFVLADPIYPDDCVAINGKGTDTLVRMHGILDGSYESNEDMWVIPEKELPGIKAAAKRQQFDTSGGFFGTPQKMKYFEYSFVVNTQVAILGIVTERIGPDGRKMLFINPCSIQSLSAEYFEQYDWNEYTQSVWAKLFEKGSAICVTDDSEYFGGVVVDPFDDADLPSVVGNDV